MKLVAMLPKSGDVYRRNTQLILINMEVWLGLLGLGVDVGEDDIFGCVVPEDDLAEEVPVGLFGVIPEQPSEVRIELEAIGVLAAEQVLISEDRGKGLQLNQFRSQGAVGGFDEAEVHGHEVGVGAVSGNPVELRDGM